MKKWLNFKTLEKYKVLKEKVIQFITLILRDSIKFIREFISRCIAMANIQRLKSFVFLLVLGGLWLSIAYFSGVQYLWIKWGIFGQFVTVGILVLIPFPEDFPGLSLVSMLIAFEAFLLAAIDISFRRGHLGLFGSLEMSLGIIFFLTHFISLISRRRE